MLSLDKQEKNVRRLFPFVASRAERTRLRNAVTRRCITGRADYDVTLAVSKCFESCFVKPSCIFLFTVKETTEDMI